MTDPITRRTYLPGSWFGIFGGSATVLLPPSEKARVAGLWALIDDGAGFDEVLDALISTGLRDLPGFVLVSELDGATQVVVRGAASAEFDTDQGLIEIAGSSATTWVEHTLSGVTRLSVVVEETETQDEALTIGAGLVRLSRVDAPPPAAESDVVDEVAEEQVQEAIAEDDGFALAPAAVVSETDAASAHEQSPDADSESHVDAAIGAGALGAGAIGATAVLGHQDSEDSEDSEDDAASAGDETEVEDEPDTAEETGASAEVDDAEDEPGHSEAAADSSDVDDDADNEIDDDISHDADDDSNDDDSHDDDSHDDDSHDVDEGDSHDDDSNDVDEGDSQDDDSNDDESHGADEDDDVDDAGVAFEDAPTGEQPLVDDVASDEAVAAPVLSDEGAVDLSDNEGVDDDDEADPQDDSPADQAPDEGAPESDESDDSGSELAGAAAVAAGAPAEVIGQPESASDEPPASTPAFGEPGSSVARISFSTGEQLEVFAPIVIGRAPDASKVQADNPTLVAVPSPSHEISSTHLDIRPGTGIDLGLAVATDLNSTNGSIVMHPGLGPRTLRPGVPEPLFPGTVIDLGDGLTIQIGTPQH